MARQILPIVGAVIGGIYGGPAGAQAGYAIGSIIGNAVDPIEVQGRKLGDSPTQTAAEGGARAIVFGTGCIRATVILERGGREVVKQRDKSGKGGPVTINERAFWTYAIGLGEAIPGGAILRIWEAEKLVYDVTPDSTIVADSAKFAEQFRFYDGTEDQLPDPALEALHGTGNAPYYRGTAYMVFPRRDLTDFGEAVPVYRAEVAAAAEVSSHLNSWNPDETVSGLTFTNSNKTATSVHGLRRGAQVDSFRGAGKWYAEVLINYIGPSTGGADVGIAPAAFTGLDEVGSALGGGCSILFDGRRYRAGTPSDFFDVPPEDGDVINIAMADGSVWFGLNGDYMGGNPALGSLPTFTGLSGDFAIAFSAGGGAGSQVTVRLKEADFTGSIPSGFAEWYDNGSSAADLAELSDILAALHERCGHTSADYNVAEATDLLAGVVIESTVTAAEAINSIIGCHFVDPSDYDGQIHYIKRGKPVVKTLTADDLIDEPESAQRNNAIEYPRKAHFLAQRADLAYAASKSTSSRYSPDAKVVGEVSYTSPETFSEPVEPAKIAVKLHKVLWTEAEGERVWHVTDEHLDLVPTDTVGLSYRGELVRCRITQIEDDPGQRKLKMIRDRQSAYTATLTEIPNPVPPTPPQSSIVAPTVLAVMDLPALTDNADTLHYYAAMSGENDNWTGAVLQQSLDGGASFATVGNATLNAIMGELQNSVTSSSGWYTDETNEVVVKLFTDETLESRSEVELLNGGGAFALAIQLPGDPLPRGWEIMQFRDAEEIGPKTWKLTGLHRGMKNTSAISHSPGDMFVLLDTALLRQAAETSWVALDWDHPLVHRGVSNGLSPESAGIVESVFMGESQREWHPAGVTATRADGVVSASVTPRQRFGTPMNPIQSANLTGYYWTVSTYPSAEPLAEAETGANELSVEIPVAWPGPIVVFCTPRNRLVGLGSVQPTKFQGEPGFSFAIIE